ncbi:MAG: tRNA 2-thiouridine(34) synthase MnmA [Candidatus Omnitrophota bacterium]
MNIAVGMSGGVDSSVTAYLLKNQGHTVTGVMMKIWRGDASSMMMKGNACYGPDEEHDIQTAQQVCSQIGIPLHIIDCSSEYEKIVLDYFREEYLAGKTPNPCIRCNQLVKFGVLPEVFRNSGIAFDKFATGHYARIEQDPTTGRFLLKKAADAHKDQTYFLYRLSQNQLATAMFPLGTYNKEEVRQIARDANLHVHDKKESQDFYSGDYDDIVGNGPKPGDIVDKDGKVLGHHQGIWRYTIGQRRGLGISHPEPLYVIAIDPKKNRVVVGTEKETYKETCIVKNCNWMSIETLTEPMTVQVKVRSTSRPVTATIEPIEKATHQTDDKNDVIRVQLHHSISSITPGQSAVFYDNDTVVGGGIIQKAK